MTGLITRLLEDMGKSAPVLIGGLALSYYSREIYFTSDMDLAYDDRNALDAVLISLDFQKKGRYWVQKEKELDWVYLEKSRTPRERYTGRTGSH